MLSVVEQGYAAAVAATAVAISLAGCGDRAPVLFLLDCSFIAFTPLHMQHKEMDRCARA